MSRPVYSAITKTSDIMGMVFLAVAKAFNGIDSEMLYRKLHLVGMSQQVVNQFRLYLNRSQLVRYGNVVSDNLGLNAGIAQGTVLRPLMFFL